MILYYKLYHLNKDHEQAVWKFLVLKSGFLLYLEICFDLVIYSCRDLVNEISDGTKWIIMDIQPQLYKAKTKLCSWKIVGHCQTTLCLFHGSRLSLIIPVLLQDPQWLPVKVLQPNKCNYWWKKVFSTIVIGISVCNNYQRVAAVGLLVRVTDSGSEGQ